MDDTYFLEYVEGERWRVAYSYARRLFNFYKSTNKRTRITWNSFYLYCLYKKYKSPDESLLDVVNAYVKLTSDKIKLIGYADDRDIYKIISRVGKKINLDQLSSDKFWSTESDPHVQLNLFMELNLPSEKKYSKFERQVLIEFSGDVATYLEREKRTGRRTVKHRDILRRFKKMKAADLLPVLDFLEAAKIISWDREFKEIFFRPAKAYLGFHLEQIKLDRDEIIDTFGKEHLLSAPWSNENRISQ